jgi:hypothetical protein
LVAVYAVAFGLAAGGVFFNPAASSVLPSIVADDQLVAANSGLWSAAVISQIALAPVAGALVATVGVTPAFLVNTASFAASALILAGLHLPGRLASSASGSWLSRMAEAPACRPEISCCGYWGWCNCWPPCRPGRPAPCW